jgi:uncharacterized protein (TIGR02996 family)
MNEGAFLSALHESPDDEVTWLALADFFEEDGQPQRAELVRLVRRLRALPVTTDRTRKRAALEDRLSGLLEDGVRPAVPEVVNDVGMRLALLPAGRFRLGSPPGEPMRGDDEDVRVAEITRPFYLGVFPVTQEEFRLVTRRRPSYYRSGGAGAEAVAGLDTSRFPVESVSWEGAVAFCEALSRRKAERQARRKYRLPTETEWEYACRGAGIALTPFAYGSSLGSTQANFDGAYPYGGADKGPHLERPCDVGSYRPNALGLHDMHGNVWEWCSDLYSQPQDQSAGNRLVRGGAYYNYAAWCRSARRGSVGQSTAYGHIGFRVAADWPAGGA